MLDLGLAIIHHLLVFGLAVMLAMELASMRTDPVPVTRLSRLDGGYGGIAAGVAVVGIVRVIWGSKGWIAYQDNPWFWAKVATFALIGLLSIMPTIQFIRWSRSLKADAGFRPSTAEVARATLWVRLEVLLLFPLVAFAAAMARHS